ncbi:cell wall-binding repeat-containing protein [Candidatus Poriferisodalis sp.]|uniref:cell wall-binding repeat-containing protein n=1 Tax=Candidatus Poriferisodalis sp. TaxID=3101277 RepID=UPI003B016769
MAGPVGAAGASELSVLRGGPVPPAQWPSGKLAAPLLEGWPNALRIWGPDRYQTSLASSLVLRGSGSFPFDSPDRGGGADTLAAADHWWGLGVCPKSVTIVAGDSQADALAAAALTDPSGGSSEPYLMRVAAADPLFDPPGGFARVDTHGAPVLLTDSARSGARKLAVPVRLAVADLRSGGCNTARQAIIVGGPAAVPAEVEAELVSVGIAEVFRVAGENRYGTAAAVAHALGTAPVPDGASTCASARGADVTDGAGDGDDGDGVAGVGQGARRPPTLAFWANSVVEWRASPTECRLLGRTVVLTDGIEGIDALAAGWWTSYWQVPVLLGDGSRRLPDETVAAMTLLDIDHIIVVGGPARLPEEVVDAAAKLTGAEVLRVWGSNRYTTSVEMAKHLGGWWPGVDPAEAEPGGGGLESAVVCVAASGGTHRSLGWPDALGAGAWCGTAAAAGAAPPPRMLGAASVSRPPSVRAADIQAADVTVPGAGAGRSSTAASRSSGAARVAVPLILVPGGADELTPSVAHYLEQMFAAPAECVDAAGTGAAGADSDAIAYAIALDAGVCPAPGFAVAFGGPDAITPAVLGQMSSILSGGLTPAAVPEIGLAGAETPDPHSPFGISSVRGVPLGVGAFVTTLAMTPVFHDGLDVPASGSPGGVVSGRSTSTGSAGRGGVGGSTGPVSSTAGDAVTVCLPRGSYPGTRWLSFDSTRPGTLVSHSLGHVDLSGIDWYRRDHDGTSRSSGEGAPGCVEVRWPADRPLLLRAVDPLGRSSPTLLVTADVGRRFGVSAPLRARNPQTAGRRDDVHGVTGVTQWVFTGQATSSTAEIADVTEPIVMSHIQIDLRRRAGDDGAPSTTTFRAEWFIRTPEGRASGTAEGEAVLRGNTWHLRGASVLNGGNWASSVLGSPAAALPEARAPARPLPAGAAVTPLRVGTSGGYGAGGFSAEIALNGHRSSDDTISWQPEAFINTVAD